MNLLRRLLGLNGKGDASNVSTVIFQKLAIPVPQYRYELEWSEFTTGRGYVVCRLKDGQRLQWQTLPQSEGVESVSVAGVSHRMDALQSPSFAPGQRVSLKPEPKNPYDPNAVGVWDKRGTLHIGYIPREHAERISRKLRTGQYDLCLSMWETVKDGKRVAIRLLLLDKEAGMKPQDA